MGSVSQPTIYENDRIWNTIDDVNATFDSLSLINRGQPTTSGLNAALNQITNNHSNDEFECVSEAPNNAVLNNEQEKSAVSGNTMGREEFFKLKSHRESADKDAALKEELDKMFPVGFSNEAIEKVWNPVVKKVEKDQFEDAYSIDSKIGFGPLKQFMQEEFEVRRCSPPFIAEHATVIKTHDSSSSSSQQESGIVAIQPISDNSLKNLEFTISDNDSGEQKQNLLLSNDVTVENVAAAQLPALRPKKCRNALLNSLDKRMTFLGEEMKEIKQPVVLRTPGDFLLPSSSNDSNHQGFFYKKQQQSKFQQQNSDSDSFEYCEDDFPAL